MSSSASREAFARHVNVSRETFDRLEIYEGLLRKWNPTINLVAKSSLEDIWGRHFLDSAQIWTVLKPMNGRVLDLGSGGGFPGLVIAILTMAEYEDAHVTCIEADIRKCQFLKTVAREVGLSLNVLSRRIEECPPQKADVICARALAPLPKLFQLSLRHAGETARLAFQKGNNWRQEVEQAQANWSFTYSAHDSITQQGSVLLEIGDLRRA